jgi:TonB-like protein
MLLRPAVVSHVTVRPALRARQPVFLVTRDRRESGWWTSLKALFASVPPPSLKYPVDLFRSTPVVKYRFAGGSLSLSVLLHIAGFLLLNYVSWMIPARKASLLAYSSEPRVIHYQLTILDRSKKLPRITPPGPGGHPGADSPKLSFPVPQSAPAHANFSAVSKPVRPDNPRQTIYQLLSPPDLRIALDQKLPNIVVGTPAVVPKPQIHFTPNTSRPNQRIKRVTTEPVPTDVIHQTTAIVVSLTDVSTPQPRLPVPTALFTNATGAAVNVQRTSQTDGGVPQGTEGNALVVISSDPSGAVSQLNLPAGNRWGDFAMTSAGNQPGPPEGSSGAAAGGSVNIGNGRGGDASTGVGVAAAGGGSVKAGSSDALSIGGGTGGSGEPGSLDPSFAASMVYPVPAVALPRRNALVVSAGPMGGGGLNVYGALHCGKIYTVFFPMPGKGWTLQYCSSGAPESKPAVAERSSIIHLEQALLPPDAEAKFDFRRLPVPLEKKLKMIVLKGVITEDGTVSNLQIFQSIVPQMDEAARAAFGRWKFKPALRGGKPVAVEILVGIPPEIPRSASAR